MDKNRNLFAASAHTAYYALFMTIASLIAAVIALSISKASSPYNLKNGYQGTEIGG